LRAAAALLRGEGSDEMASSDLIGDAPCITSSSVDQHATQWPRDHAIAGRSSPPSPASVFCDVGVGC